jgi:HEPN domain-containing protein
MNELANEWLKKAEGDYNSAIREYRARKFPNYDAAGFHAQQCIEKYLKAILQANGIRFYKIHDLLALMELCLPFVPELEFYKEFLAYLNLFSVAFRYPGESANKLQAKKAIKSLKLLKPVLIEKIRFSDK